MPQPLFGRPRRGPRIQVGPKAARTRQTRFGTVVFDSVAEARRWDQLDAAWSAGAVVTVILQPPFYLPGGTSWRADFLVFWDDGHVTIEDVKGQRTQAYLKAKKQVEDLYGIEITEIEPSRLR